jgi:hypothetical protein
MPSHDRERYQDKARIKTALWQALEALGPLRREASTEALLEFWLEATMRNLEETQTRYPDTDLTIIADRLVTSMNIALRDGIRQLGPPRRGGKDL